MLLIKYHIHRRVVIKFSEKRWKHQGKEKVEITDNEGRIGSKNVK